DRCLAQALRTRRGRDAGNGGLSRLGDRSVAAHRTRRLRQIFRIRAANLNALLTTTEGTLNAVLVRPPVPRKSWHDCNSASRAFARVNEISGLKFNVNRRLKISCEHPGIVLRAVVRRLTWCKRMRVMRSLKVALFAGAAFAAATNAASAADLPPIMQPRPTAPVHVAEFSGSYLRGDVGVGVQQFKSFD